MPWLALTLQVDADAAERFTQALLDAGAQSVSLENPQGAQQAVGALLGMHADAGALVRDAATAAGLERAPEFRVEQVEDQDWVRGSQAQFAPLEIGARLWIGPSWHAAPADGRAVIRLDPGLAFGTGSHPTTRLVLRFLEREVQGGEDVLDYGCGSGILAIAAAKLGAARVDAVDIDPQALDATAANARANGAPVRAALPGALAPALYNVVVSNILAQPLIMLAPLLTARTAPRGRIALAGVLESQALEAAAAYAPGFEIGISSLEEGWALIEGVRK
ncbi:MAG TPA: 50S ribosomal protein L11 methyltransferase [Burkholderiales bacterium]|nr:50S ribosomal protein L11 methyltransferase [Burkholderiales bacterium]